MTYLESIRGGLQQLLGDARDTLIVGEDLLDPYGGAFKVTRGLSTQFPDRVISTPISEAGIVGAAVGAALRGARVVVEIMFADFLGLAFDQIFNHLSKYQYMYSDVDRLQLVIRTPAGGGRGYGPTHSQSPEKYFAGMPGMRVFAPSLYHDPGAMLVEAMERYGPAIFIEAKLLYGRELITPGGVAERGWRMRKAERSTDVVLSNADVSPQLTVATYGAMASLAEEAAFALLVEEELSTDLIVVGELSGASPDAMDSAARTGRLLFVEEGTTPNGIASETAAQLLEAAAHVRLGRIGTDGPIIPSAKHLEERLIPTVDKIKRAMRALLQ